jgi:hypothetical protein
MAVRGALANLPVNTDGLAISHASAVAVTTSSTTVLAANPARLYALLVNDSDTTLYLALGDPAVAGRGIRLNAQGGAYEISQLLGNLYTGVITAIHAGTGSKSILPTEGV